MKVERSFATASVATSSNGAQGREASTHEGVDADAMARLIESGKEI